MSLEVAADGVFFNYLEKSSTRTEKLLGSGRVWTNPELVKVKTC